LEKSVMSGVCVEGDGLGQLFSGAAGDQLDNQAPAPRARWFGLDRQLLLRSGLFAVAMAAIGQAALGFLINAPLTDFAKFYFTATAFWRGEEMYAPAPATSIPHQTLDGSKVEIDGLNMNPPHFHFLVLPLIWLSPKLAYLAWILIGAAGVGLAYWNIRQAFPDIDRSWFQQLVWILFLGGTPTHCLIGLGQVTWILVLPATMLWLSARQERWKTCGLCLGVLCALKPFFLISARPCSTCSRCSTAQWRKSPRCRAGWGMAAR
jgi:hypothetical protein